MRGFLCLSLIVFLIGCGTSKKIRTGAKGIEKEQTTLGDSKLVKEAESLLKEDDRLDFETFSFKAKVEYQDSSGKQPDATAHLRMKKDQYIWLSITATFLNVEAARILITPDSVIVIHKLYKYIMERPLGFVEQRFGLPLNFSDIQKLILGELVLTDGKVDSAATSDNFLHIVSQNPQVRNDIYYTLGHSLLTRQSLQVEGASGAFSADILYENYLKDGNKYFSTYRDVTIPIIGLHLKADIKSYEFNKELSAPFTRPDSYTRL